jgi:hypothetical protein
MRFFLLIESLLFREVFMNIRNRCERTILSAALAGSIALSSCGFDEHGNPRFCQARPDFCAVVAFVLIAGIMAASAGSSAAAMSYYPSVSDPRLKKDIIYLETLDNGIRIYAFRYKGQTDGFVGVMADDLLKDPRYAHAVTRGPNGFLRVDYGQLPVQLSNYQAMVSASDKVLEQFEG